MKRTCGDGKGGEDIRRQNRPGSDVWRAGRGGETPKEQESGAARDGEESQGRMVQDATAQRGAESGPAEAKQKARTKESTKLSSRVHC